MKIATERLELLPLTPLQLGMWVENLTALAEDLHVTYEAEPMKGFFPQVVRGQQRSAEADPENYLWYTFWFLIRKCDRTVIGSVVFKTVPNQNGEVELGYGLGNAFEHEGYMTEAVKALCDWALKQDAVKAVVAETDLTGVASQRLLERCGFEKTDQGETIWWRLSI